MNAVSRGHLPDMLVGRTKEGSMPPVMVVHHTPTLTRERYLAVVRGLTGGKDRLDTPADIPTGGLLVHVAAQTDEGFMIFDVFESQEAFDRFRTLRAPSRPRLGSRNRRRVTRC
jgi:hypothetical protein